MYIFYKFFFNFLYLYFYVYITTCKGNKNNKYIGEDSIF